MEIIETALADDVIEAVHVFRFKPGKKDDLLHAWPNLRDKHITTGGD